MTHIAGAHATAQLVAIEACITGGSGDRLEACVEPEPGWMSDRDADWLAGVEEDRRERQLEWFL